MDEGLFVSGESLLNDSQDGMVERITRQSKKRLLEGSITPSSVTTNDKRQTQKRKQRSPKDEFNPYVKMMRLGPKQMNNVLAYDTDEDRDQRDEAYEDTYDTEEMTREVAEMPTSNSELQDKKSKSDINSLSKSVKTTSKASVSCGKTAISKMSKEKLVIKIAPLAKASIEMPVGSGKTAAVKRQLKEKLVLEIAPVSKASTKVTTSSDESGLDKVKSKECAVMASSEVPVLSDMVTSDPNEKLDVSVAPIDMTSNELAVPKNNVKKLALFWEDFTVKAKVKASEPKSVSQETSAAVANLELVAQPDSTTTDQETAQLPMDTSGASSSQSEHESYSVSSQSCKTPNKMTPNKKTMPGTPKSPKEVLEDNTKTVQIAKSKFPVTGKSSKSSKGLDVTEESPGKWGKKSFRRLFPDPLAAESSPEVLESQTPKKKRSSKKRSLMSLNPAVYSQFFSPPPNEASLDSTTEIGNSSIQARRSVDDESFVLSEVTVEEPIGGSEIPSCNDSLLGLSVDVSSAISNTSRMDSSVLDNSTVKRAISAVVTGVLGDDTSVAVTDSSAIDEGHVATNNKKTVSLSPGVDSPVDSPDPDSSSDDPPPLYPAINKDDILPPALSPHPPVLENLNMPQGENLSKTTSRDDASNDDMPDLISTLSSLRPPVLSPHPAGIEILKKTNPNKQVISKSSSHSQVMIQESQHPVGESGMRDKTTPVDIPVLASLPTYDMTSNTEREPVETAMDLTCYENHDKENIPTTGQSQDRVSQPFTSQNSNQASNDNVLDSEQSETESQFSPSYLSTSQLLWSPTPVLDQSPQPQVLTNRKSVKRPRKLVFDDVLNQAESHPDVKKLKSAELRKPDKPKRTTSTIVSKTSSIGKLAIIMSPTKTYATVQPTLSTNLPTCAVTSPVHFLPTSHQVPATAGPSSSTPVIETFQRRIYEPKSAQPVPSATSTPLVQSSQSAQPAPSATSAPSIKTFQKRIYEPKSSRPAGTSGSSGMTEQHDSIAEQTDQVFFGASFKPTVTSERNSSVFWKQDAVGSFVDMKTASCEVDAPTIQASVVLDMRITPEGADNERRYMKSSNTIYSQKSSTVGQQPLQTSTPISSQNSRPRGHVRENQPVSTIVRVNAPVSTYQLASQGQNKVLITSQQVESSSVSTYQQTSQNQNRLQSSTQRVNTPAAVCQYGSEIPTMVQSADQRITASLSTFNQTSQVPNSCSQQVNLPVSSYKHASQVPGLSQVSIQARPVISHKTNPHKGQHQTKTFSLFDHVTNIVQERLSKQLKQRQTLLYNDVVLTDMRRQTENVPSVGSVYSGSSQPNNTTAQTDSAPQYQNYPRMSLEDSPDVQPQGHAAEGTTATHLNFNQNLWQPHRQVSPFIYESSVCSRMQNLKPYTISGWISPSYLQALMQKTDLLNDMFSNALDHKGDVKDWVVENCRKSSPAVLARDLVFRIITLGKLERAVMLYNNMNCLPRSKMGAIRRCIQKQFPREFDETIWRKKCLPYIKASVKVLLKHRVPQVQKYWLMNDSSAV